MLMLTSGVSVHGRVAAERALLLVVRVGVRR